MQKHEQSGGIADVDLAAVNSTPSNRPITQKVSGSTGGAKATRPNDPKH